MENSRASVKNNNAKSKLVKIAGLWMNEARTAIKSAKIEKDIEIKAGMRLIVLPNTKKEHDRQPDYAAFLAPIESPQPATQGAVPSFDDFVN